MPNGHVTHAEKDGIVVLRYFGRVDYMSAPAIKTFAEHLLAQHAVFGIVFDLSEAENLDSTNLGLVARLADRVKREGGARSVIVSTREDINCVLCSMGFEQICEIVGAPPCSAASTPSGDELQSGPPAQEELRDLMLEAHRTLMALSDAGRVQFQDVVKCLEAS